MKKLGLVLAALAGFVLVAAIMLKFYAYPKLAVAPKDQNSVTLLEGPDSTIFDISALEEVTTDLTTEVATVGDVAAANEEGNGVVVWLSKSSTKSADGVVRTRSVDRAAFDAHTGEAVNCCGEFVESVQDDQEPIEHKGLISKFPFGTEKKTYQWWDSSLREAVDIRYVKTEKIDGMETYVFSHTIEPTQTATIELPADLLGEEGEESLEAQRMYSNTRTLWVEPNTGVVIDRVEEQNSTIDYDGSTRITATKATNSFTDDQVAANVKEYKSKASMLGLVNGPLPILLVLVGLLLAIGGFVLARRQGEEPGAELDEE